MGNSKFSEGRSFWNTAAGLPQSESGGDTEEMWLDSAGRKVCSAFAVSRNPEEIGKMSEMGGGGGPRGSLCVPVQSEAIFRLYGRYYPVDR